MAYCANCGSQVGEGQFCPKCGASIASGTGTIPPASSPNVPMGLSVNAASALCYLFGFITGIFFLVIAPYNQDRRVRFNAFQSIFLNVAVIAVHIGIAIITAMFHVISFSLGIMMSSLHALVSLGFFLLWLYMMWKNSQGENIVLPIIGAMAERQAGSDSTTGTIGRAA